MIVMNNDNICKKEKIIEVVADYSNSGCLKKSDFKNNSIVCLPLKLSFGDLKSLDNYNRKCLKVLYPNDEIREEDFIFQKEIEVLKSADKIRIWSSRTCADEFLLLIYICSLFTDKNISVVFADEFSSFSWSIGCMTPEEVNELAKKEHLLSNKEVKCYISEWKKIVKENSSLRYIENKQIKSVPIDYFDEVILSYLNNREIRLIVLIAELMGYDVIDHTSHSVYEYLVNRLIEQGKIEIVKINEDGKKIIRATTNN